MSSVRIRETGEVLPDGLVAAANDGARSSETADSIESFEATAVRLRAADGLVFGPDFRAVFEPSDGSLPITLRPLVAEDREELRAGFRKLSPSVRFFRFFADLGDLTEAQLDYLTTPDGTDHFALVATTATADLRLEQGLAVARFIRVTPGSSTAEVAITVTDDAQRKGLGRALLSTLALAARERGITHFRMDVLASNEAMLTMAQRLGADELPSDEPDVRVFDLALPQSGSDLDQAHSLARIWTETVESLRRNLTLKATSPRTSE
ncbi:MAG: GNAT family N-acetyltransferase [Deltaproteobacteria bacterium]|nr:GNAT family N-acetyltransferase [Deltaproteobacteria bacterium]